LLPGDERRECPDQLARAQGSAGGLADRATWSAGGVYQAGNLATPSF
jgi:hypothetical protein